MMSRTEAVSRYPELGQLIGGTFEPHGGREMLDVVDPATGGVISQVPMSTERDIDQALRLAEHGFGIWSRTPAVERAKILRKVADTMRERAHELAALVVLELGKPWREALGEVEVAAGMWEWAAEEGRRAYGRVVPPREVGQRQFVLMEPLGPIAGFASWNAPLVTPSRKMSGALGSGCSIVLKASEEVPACCLAIGKIAYECGLPEGALSILVGDPVLVSSRLIDSPVIRGITFTGSTRIGKLLSEQAVSRMKRPIMELGGHAPVLVFEDVDVEEVARAATAAKFTNAGQICVSPTRFYVHKSVYADLVDAMKGEAEKLVLGCGFDSETTMGPLSSRPRLEALADLVDDARKHGLRVASGGLSAGGPGFFYEPTILADGHEQAKVSREEPFGPIAVLSPFETYEQAIAFANGTDFGLAAYVQSSNAQILNRAIDDIAAGMVICNGWRAATPETPFGGVKDSGFYSEGGIEGLRAFQNVKYAFIG
ncbi:NAD-dependent succinate-semialdehyde dehydrogenase [Mesorhizobium sp. A556]